MISTRVFQAIVLSALMTACGSYYQNPNYGGNFGNSGEDGGVGGANLFVTVQFNGQVESCLGAGVDKFSVSVAGVMLQPSTTACRQGPAALEVFDLNPGSVNITVDALQNGTVLFSGSQMVMLTEGANQLALNLLPVLPDAGVEVDAGIEPDSGTPDSGTPDSGTPDSGTPDAGAPDAGTVADAGTSFTATFLFGAPQTGVAEGMTCAEAGVQSVALSIDSAAATVLPCPSTNNATVQTAAGAHNLAWSGFASTDGSGTATYSATESAQSVSQGTANDFNVNFAGLVNGGFEVQWNFPGTSNCATVGAATVTYDVADAQGNELAGFPASSACGAGNFTISATPGLTPGVYALVSMKAQDVSGHVVGSAGPMRLYAPAGQVATFTALLAP